MNTRKSWLVVVCGQPLHCSWLSQPLPFLSQLTLHCKLPMLQSGC